MTNHLGNVYATISDKKIGVPQTGNSSLIDYYNADVIAASDYAPFGMPMAGRRDQGTYRYGFNGKEEDDEVKGDGDQLDYGFRIYDPRIGRFLSVDPLFKGYPWYTPYQFAGNMPIWAIDLDGLEEKKSTLIRVNKIMDPQGNLIKGSVIGISDGGKVATISSGETVLKQGDADGAIIYEEHIYTVHSGLRSDGLPEIAHTAVCCKNKEVPANNLVQTNDNDETEITPPTTRKSSDVITWWYGTRTTATPIIKPNYFSKDLDIEFQEATHDNPGIGFVNNGNKNEGLDAIASYAKELKANNITSINFKISTEYKEGQIPNYPDYYSALDLVKARAKVIAGLFAAQGIKATLNDWEFDATKRITARATKATTTIIGYNVTTTPIRQKLVNGNPVGTPRIDGGSRRTLSPTKPNEGDKWRRR